MNTPKNAWPGQHDGISAMAGDDYKPPCDHATHRPQDCPNTPHDCGVCPACARNTATYDCCDDATRPASVPDDLHYCPFCGARGTLKLKEWTCHPKDTVCGCSAIANCNMCGRECIIITCQCG